MRPFSLLIKPASADCNLRCAYCFYSGVPHPYPGSGPCRMSDPVLECVISGYMATEQPQYVFCWQGGEPTLMGLEFYRRVVELQQKHGRSGARVANALQTNATVISSEFAAHLAAYNFLVGVSLDGPAEIHDRFRVETAGRGSHEATLRGMGCLRQQGVEFNVLTVVSSANVRRGRQVYGYLRDMGILYHQYIPCVEFDEHGQPLPFTISAGEWGDFLCEVYDEWVRGDTRRVSVRLFDSILALMVDGTRNLCQMADECCQYFVIEHNGDIYPCDFFVKPGLKLANAEKCSWERLQASSTYKDFGRRKSEWGQTCRRCNYFRYCSGDCPRNRLSQGKATPRLSWLCRGWRQFYGHALPGLQDLARWIGEQHHLPQS